MPNSMNQHPFGNKWDDIHGAYLLMNVKWNRKLIYKCSPSIPPTVSSWFPSQPIYWPPAVIVDVLDSVFAPNISDLWINQQICTSEMDCNQKLSRGCWTTSLCPDSEFLGHLSTFWQPEKSWKGPKRQKEICTFADGVGFKEWCRARIKFLSSRNMADTGLICTRIL
jgi:hypothetical protein